MDKDTSSKIGENIRRIREAYGLSQETLGKLIHVTRVTVHKYEKGSLEVPNPTLKAISDAFYIPVDDIRHGEIMIAEKGSLRLDPNLFYKQSPNIFPIIKADVPNESDCGRALFFHIRAFERIKTEGMTEDFIDTLIDCMTLYEKSYENSFSSLECAANYIGLSLFMFLILKDYALIKNQSEALRAIYKDKKMIDKAINYYESLSAEDQKEFESMSDPSEIIDSDEYTSIMKYIKQLRASDKYTDLAYYYIALMHLLRLYYLNDYPEDLNALIGNEMMWAFSRAGNKYARRYCLMTLKMRRPEK